MNINEGENSPASRPSAGADYHSTVWGDFFIITQNLPSPPNLHSEELIKRRIGELVEDVKGMLRSSISLAAAATSSSPVGGGEWLLQLLELVDDIERLREGDRRSLALRPRCPRRRRRRPPRHRAPFPAAATTWLPCFIRIDVFKKFANGENKFDEAAIGEDTRGLLSLYEAAYFRVSGEDLLDKAIVFALAQLSAKLPDDDRERLIDNKGSGALKKLVGNALKTPLLKKIRRLEARHYIDIFAEEAKEEAADANGGSAGHDILLELAKLDFNVLQSLHREEVRMFCTWWKSLGLKELVQNFSRDRTVECFFWGLVLAWEPKHSRARMMVAKMFALLSVLDDLYDNYGTYQELLPFTKVIQSWDLAVVDDGTLDEIMEMVFLKLAETMKELEAELILDGGLRRAEHLKFTMKILCEAYLKEAKWRDEGHVPSLSEYLEVSCMSAGVTVLASGTIIGIGVDADREDRATLEWLESSPLLLRCLGSIGRIMNDIVSHEFQGQRKHVASAVECYMREHDEGGGRDTTLLMEEAHQVLREMVEKEWQTINEGLLRWPATVPTAFAEVVLNFARSLDMMYSDIDAYTHSSTVLKDYITFFLVQPIAF